MARPSKTAEIDFSARHTLTEGLIDRATCPPGRSEVALRDSEVPALRVRILASGIKSFVAERKLDRRTVRKTIGSVANWSIKDARVRATQLSRDVDQGVDPVVAQREAKLAEAERLAAEAERKITEEAARLAAEEAARALAERTLAKLLGIYVGHLRAHGKNSADDVERLVRVHVMSDPLASRPAARVTSTDVTALLRRIVEKGHGRTAAKVRAYLHAAFKLGVGAGLDARAPSVLIEFALASNPVASTSPLTSFNATRDRVLDDDELRHLLERLETDDSTPALAARLLLLLGGQRSAQMLRARVEDYDAAEHVLRLLDGKGRRATPRKHHVPVEGAARKIVATLIDRARAKGSPLIFTSDGKSAMLPGTLNAVVRDACAAHRAELLKVDPDRHLPKGYSTRDFRRTIETRLASRGISKDIRAQLQSHGLGGVQDRHYDRHDYAEEKRHALHALHQHFDDVRRG